MGQLLTTVAIRHDVVQCSSLLEVAAVKDRTLALNSTIQKSMEHMTKYDKQKSLETIESLMRFIEVKKNSLETLVFRFEGEPIETRSLINVPKANEFKVSPYLENIKEQTNNITKPVNYFSVSGFDSCVIINEGMSVSANLEKGRNSVVKIAMDGTVYATDLERCILVCDCHQLRLHNILNTLIVANIKTNIIIENCKQLRFSGKVTIDDFNFGFNDSQSYQLVEYNEQQLDWIGKIYDSNSLSDCLTTAGLS